MADWEPQPRPEPQVATSELVKLLIETSPAAIALFDRDMRYLAFSPRWVDDYVLGERELLGCSHYKIFPGVSEDWRAIHRRALAGETLSRDFDPITLRDGSVDWIRWKMMPWRCDRGKIAGILISSEVLTPDLKDRARARTLGNALNLLVDSARQHAIILLDVDGRVLIWNRGAENLFGWKEAEVLGKYYGMFFEPEDREREFPAKQLLKAREHGIFTTRAWRLRKDGSRLLAQVTITPIYSEGQLIGYGRVVADVTDEAERSRKLEASAVHLKSIVDTVPDAMVVIDERGIVESFSAAAEKLFGYASAEVVGRNVSMLMPAAERDAHDGYIARYLRTGQRRIIGNARRVLGRRKDGTTFPHELSIGEAVGGGRRVFTGFLRDLTEREQAEARLQELQTELVRISRVSAVGTMATSLAHELNQPLMAIANYVQASAAMLGRSDDNTSLTVRDALDSASQEVLRAGRIVHRLRDFVSHGELDTTIEEPADLAEQACSLGAIDARARGISCSLAIAPDARPVLVDRVQIQQVLLNLIRNALDVLVDGGEIKIEAANEPASGMTRFSVTDDGPGVPDEAIRTLFQPFVSNKSQGMGIGLSICRTIVEAHGGRMWFEAPYGGGAAFHFTLPTIDAEGHRYV